MDQIKLVISGAGDKVAGAASDASKKLASVTGDKKSATKADAPSEAAPDALMSTCPSLTRQQRLIGFASCFVLGYLVSFGSTFALIAGSDNGTKFGITYSLGNIISLCGSGFLVGPKQQVKLMFKPVRRVATIIYLVMIVVVLTVAIAAPQLGLVVLLLVLIQCVAAVWYDLLL
ncbi:Transmembrane protein [Phytophthora palmivora]|uniref:Vesicle transport protein n=1 Tax=Phytophthora palmivora TaxID=4796 RepID=A0A2P4X1F3_9STRA|nr:Transmembrane protein [Phytophthora palmivora]